MGDCNQFNFMRKSILGSQVSSSKKEMSLGQNHLQQKSQPCLKQQTQSPIYNRSFQAWRIIHSDKQIFLTSLNLESKSYLATIDYHSAPQADQDTRLVKDKRLQAQSLINYLSGAHKVFRGQHQSSMHSILFALLKLLKVDSNSITERIWSNYQSQNKKIDIQQLTKPNRNKQIICFSSKWRVPQTTLYLLPHTYQQQNSKESTINALLLNQNGLILQALMNVKKKRFWEQVTILVKKYYQKLQNFVIVSQKGENINLDDFQKISSQFQNIPVLMVNAINKEAIQTIINKQKILVFKNDLIQGTYVSLSADKQVIIWSNTPLSQQLTHKVSLIPTILTLQQYVASLFKNYNYNSIHFWHRQILVRLYSFYFNFATLNSMEASSKQELMNAVMKNELSAMQIRECGDKSENLIAHTFMTHQSPLHCVVCNKRTKIKCEKCCFKYNRYFGICQKECFEKFHCDIPSYRFSILKRKQVINHNLVKQSRQEDQQMSSLSRESIKGRKKVKMNQDSPDSSCGFQSQDNESGIQGKWNKTIEEQHHQRDLFKNNVELGFLPEMFMKKMEHLEKMIAQMREKSPKKGAGLVKSQDPN